MQITSSNALYATTAANRLGSAAGSTRAAGTAPATADADGGSGVSTYGFTSMTPREMQMAINKLIKNGQMTAEKSFVLVGMAPAPLNGASPEALPTFDQPMDYLSQIKRMVDSHTKAGNQESVEDWSKTLSLL